MRFKGYVSLIKCNKFHLKRCLNTNRCLLVNPVMSQFQVNKWCGKVGSVITVKQGQSSAREHVKNIPSSFVGNNLPEWFDWRSLLKKSHQLEVWTENYDHYLDLTTKVAALPLLISYLLEQYKRQDRCLVKYRYFTSIFLFIESHKLNIMWQQPQNIVQYTSIYSNFFVPTQAKMARILFFIIMKEKYPSVYTNALHIMLGEVQFTCIQFQCLKSKDFLFNPNFGLHFKSKSKVFCIMHVYLT